MHISVWHHLVTFSAVEVCSMCSVFSNLMFDYEVSSTCWKHGPPWHALSSKYISILTQIYLILNSIQFIFFIYLIFCLILKEMIHRLSPLTLINELLQVYRWYMCDIYVWLWGYQLNWLHASTCWCLLVFKVDTESLDYEKIKIKELINNKQ